MCPLDIFGEPEGLAISGDEGFFASVHRIVRGIPTGKVATYSGIARSMGRPGASLVVGWALRAADGKDLPCHRVVRVDGGLSPEAVFGPGVQRSVLETEGVTFTREGKVDMGKHLWNPCVT